jgi:hypothetical protein
MDGPCVVYRAPSAHGVPVGRTRGIRDAFQVGVTCIGVRVGTRVRGDGWVVVMAAAAAWVLLHGGRAKGGRRIYL